MNIDAALQQHVIDIARNAGAAIMAVYQREGCISGKIDHPPLTEANTAAYQHIASQLAILTPDIPILSEEAVDKFPGPDNQGRYWLVDPLDGAREFIKRSGEFTVNIALIECGRAVLGVVHAPALGITYHAAKGLGACKIGHDGIPVHISVSRHKSGMAWRVVGSRTHAGKIMTNFLHKLGQHVLVPIGSSLRICLVAEGIADVYPRLRPTSLWDTAAAQCIIEEAGGNLTLITGGRLDYRDYAAHTNPYFIAQGRNSANWPRLLFREMAHP